jgi:hypothetical protein
MHENLSVNFLRLKVTPRCAFSSCVYETVFSFELFLSTSFSSEFFVSEELYRWLCRTAVLTAAQFLAGFPDFQRLARRLVCGRPLLRRPFFSFFFATCRHFGTAPM